MNYSAKTKSTILAKYRIQTIGFWVKCAIPYATPFFTLILSFMKIEFINSQMVNWIIWCFASNSLNKASFIFDF